MCYIHLACRAAKQRRVHSCKRKRRSANSVAASLPRRSVAAPTVSQRGSRVAASQRQQRRSVAAPTASQRHSRSVAAPTASQRHWPNGSVAASQRHSVAGPWQRRSVAASQRHPPSERRSVAASQRHPPPGASQRNVGNPRFGPLCPCTGIPRPRRSARSFWAARSRDQIISSSSISSAGCIICPACPRDGGESR